MIGVCRGNNGGTKFGFKIVIFHIYACAKCVLIYSTILRLVKEMLMNLNQVTLPVTNMDAAAEFYLQLGFTQIVDTPHYARFECPEGNATFSLSLEDVSYSNGAVIYFEHEALDEWVTLIKSKGIEFEQEPTEQNYLWREAILYDPSGNKIKLYWAGENRLNPPWRVEKYAK